MCVCSYLRAVERLGEGCQVSAQLTATGDRLLLLHDVARSDEPVRAFLADAQDAFVRCVLNPFYAPGDDLRSCTALDARIRAAARKHLDK